MNKATKNVLCYIALFSSLCFMSACNNNQKDDKEEGSKIPTTSENVKILDGVKFDNSKAFFDDFTNGVDYDSWIISEDCWGSNKGGLTVKNLFYTDEGTLIFRSNGNYYSDNEVRGYGQLKDGRCTGASLVSKFQTGPGRYEIKMKPMPRIGSCTAFWTYCNRPVSGAENDNHEIDIELPGGYHYGIHSFKYMMNTNYITETYMDNSDFKLSDVTNNKVINLNDGEFHTFGFDWYTNPELIVYFVDDVITCVSDTFIPYLETRLWIAIWTSISDGFMGAPNYETDFMEIDWVKYLPFDSTQPYTPFKVDAVSLSCPKEDYPTSPVSRPIVNKVANGDFEYFIRKNVQDNYGWNYEKFLRSGDTTPVSELCYADQVAGKDGTSGAVVKKNGYLYTVVDSTYEGYDYDISFDAMSDGTDSVCEIVYYSSYVPDTNPIKSEFINISQGEWANYKKSVVCPEGCSSMTIEFYNNSRNSVSEFHVDNVKMSRSAN